jgi:hypothetical protein
MTRKQTIDKIAISMANDFATGSRDVITIIKEGMTGINEMMNFELEQLYYETFNEKITINGK